MARFPNAVDAIYNHDHSGVYVLGSDGGVGAFGKAVFHKSYHDLPASQRKGDRKFVSIVLNDRGGYDLLADDGSAYSFPI